MVDGVAAKNSFGNRILYEARDAHTVAERRTLANQFASIVLGFMSSGAGIYTVTISPAVAPGSTTKDRTSHVTVYIEDNEGKRAMPAGKSIAPLQICADFFKEAGQGNGGNMFFRGVLNETEVDTDETGSLQKPTGALLNQLENAATALKALFENQGGRGLVMPGRQTDDNGAFVSLQNWTESARNVDDLFFEGFVFRQTDKNPKSIELEERGLLRRRITQLVKAYADFKKFAPNGVIELENEQTLYQLGEEIFVKHSATDRNRAKVPTFVKKYIRKPQ